MFGVIAILPKWYQYYGKSSCWIGVLAVIVTACTPLSQKQAKLETQDKTDAVYNILAAEFALQAGQEETAADHYAAAAKTTSDVNTLRSALILAYQQKDYKTAIRLAEQWAEQDPDNPEAKQRLAAIYLSTHNVDNAIAVLEKMSVQELDHFFLNVRQYHLLETEDKTLVTLEKVVQQFPNHYIARYLYATMALQLGQYATADSNAEQLIALDPDRVDGYQIKAQALMQQDRVEEAIALLRDGMLKQVAGIQMRKEYARALIENQQYQEAYTEMLQVYSMDQNDPEVFQILGIASLGLDEPDEALQYFEALSVFPGLNLRAKYFQAHIWYTKKEYPKAIALLNEIPPESGDVFTEAQLMITRIYQELEQIDAAIEQLQNARELNTDKEIDITLYLAQGELLKAQEAYSDEYILYTDSIAEYQEVIVFRYMRAMAAYELGHMDLMESDIQFILEKQPLNVDALNALGYCLADKNMRLDEARDYIMRAMELSPDNPAVIDSLGWVEFRLNNLLEAETLIRAARDKLSDPVIHGHLVEVLRAKNQMTEAQKYLWEALQEFPDNKYLQKLNNI